MARATLDRGEQHRLAGAALGLAGVIIFSATLPMTRIALELFDPWFITCARASLAGLVGLWLITQAPRPAGRQWRDLAISGLCLIYLFPGFMAIGMQTVDAGRGGVVVGILPLMTAVTATWLAGERPSPLFWFWSAAGACIILIFVLDGRTWSVAPGDLWLIMSAVACSIGYALSGRLARTMPGWAVIGWTLVMALPFNLVLTVLLWHPDYASLQLPSWSALIYLSLFSMLIGFFAWNAGLALGGIARVSQIQLTQTFFTIAIAAWLLGEPVTIRTVAFALVVAVIILFARRARIDHARS